MLCRMLRLQAVNAVLRKEVAAGVSEARRGLAAGDLGGGEQDTLLTKQNSVRRVERRELRSTNHSYCQCYYYIIIRIPLNSVKRVQCSSLPAWSHAPALLLRTRPPCLQSGAGGPWVFCKLCEAWSAMPPSVMIPLRMLNIAALSAGCRHAAGHMSSLGPRGGWRVLPACSGRNR